MSDLCVIVPSRGRPGSIHRLIEGWKATGAEAHLLVAIDDDDPERDAYLTMLSAHNEDRFIGLVIGERRRLGPTLNHLAIAQAQRWTTPGFMGIADLPQTPGWDVRMVKELEKLRSGIVYGNDLFQGPNLPTAVFMTSDIVRALGYMYPPGLIHMYGDNAWLAWGRGMGRITYLPDMVIEHLHAQAGKSEVDSSYTEVWPYMEIDRPAWEKYQANQLDIDIDSCEACCDRAPGHRPRLPLHAGVVRRALTCSAPGAGRPPAPPVRGSRGRPPAERPVRDLHSGGSRGR